MRNMSLCFPPCHLSFTIMYRDFCSLFFSNKLQIMHHVAKILHMLCEIKTMSNIVSLFKNYIDAYKHSKD